MGQLTRRIIEGLVIATACSGVGVVMSGPTTHASGADPDRCFVKVLEQRYERTPVIDEAEYIRQVTSFDTQHQIEKQVRGNIEHSSTLGVWTSPFDWTDWPNAGPVWDDGRFRGPGGHSGTFTSSHDGHTDTYRATEYRYVETGTTRLVPNGTTTERRWSASAPGDPWTATGASRTVAGTTESSGWVRTPPAGEDWKFVEERTSDGVRTPCDEKPDDGVVERSSDGTCEPGDENVTVEHFRTAYTFVLDEEFRWVKRFGEEQQLDSTTRSLDTAEQRDCQPVRADTIVTADGEFGCDDVTVDQVITTTSYTYDYVGGGWIESSSTVSNAIERPLDDDEMSSCPGPTSSVDPDGTAPDRTGTPTTEADTPTTEPDQPAISPTPTTDPGGDDDGPVPPPAETTVATDPDPEPTTTVATTVPVEARRGTSPPPTTATSILPRTGGSGSSGTLRVAALLLLTGLVVVGIARRRDSSLAG